MEEEKEEEDGKEENLRATSELIAVEMQFLQLEKLSQRSRNRTCEYKEYAPGSRDHLEQYFIIGQSM